MLLALAGLPLPTGVDGVDLSPLFADPTATNVTQAAFSQQARCYQKNSPTNPTPEQKLLTRMMTCEFVDKTRMDFMGYSLRTNDFRYTEWVKWNGTALKGEWEHNVGIELYDHRGDVLGQLGGEDVNIAGEAQYATEVKVLSAQLRAHFGEGGGVAVQGTREA